MPPRLNIRRAGHVPVRVKSAVSNVEIITGQQLRGSVGIECEAWNFRPFAVLAQHDGIGTGRSRNFVDHVSTSRRSVSHCGKQVVDNVRSCGLFRLCCSPLSRFARLP